VRDLGDTLPSQRDNRGVVPQSQSKIGPRAERCTFMSTPRDQLADALRQARIGAGYDSHRALARVLNVSRPVLSRAENCREGVPSDRLITSIADATNADPAMLLDLAERARNPRSFFAKVCTPTRPSLSVLSACSMACAQKRYPGGRRANI